MGSVSHNSYFDVAEAVEPDGIFEVLRRYNTDSSPEKVNICVGAYRDQDGKPWVLPSVRMAEKKIAGLDHEYSPMMGHKGFRDASIELLFHGSKALAENRVSPLGKTKTRPDWSHKTKSYLLDIRRPIPLRDRRPSPCRHGLEEGQRCHPDHLHHQPHLAQPRAAV